MYNKLAKQLQYCATHDCANEGEVEVGCTAPYEGREGATTCNDVLMLKAADAIDELLKIAKAMHTWIFLNSVDEQKAYEECGLTDEINFALGYGGKAVVKLEEDEAHKPYDLLYEEGGLGIR